LTPACPEIKNASTRRSNQERFKPRRGRNRDDTGWSRGCGRLAARRDARRSDSRWACGRVRDDNRRRPRSCASARPSPSPFSFVPLDISGSARASSPITDLDVAATDFTGDAKMQQAMAADSNRYRARLGTRHGVHRQGFRRSRALPRWRGPPLLLALVVRPDGPQSVAEMKGQDRERWSTVGSLTYWLVSENLAAAGLGTERHQDRPDGRPTRRRSSLSRAAISTAMVADISTAFDLEKNHKGRILMRFGDLVKDFHIHVNLSRPTRRSPAKPEALRSFLAGWFRDHLRSCAGTRRRR